jgi:hypothetical protein
VLLGSLRSESLSVRYAALGELRRELREDRPLLEQVMAGALGSSSGSSMGELRSSSSSRGGKLLGSFLAASGQLLGSFWVTKR